MMYPMDVLKAEHDYRRERLARPTRPRRSRQRWPPRQHLAALLLSIKAWTPGEGVARGRKADSCATDPASAG
jgi:hypothetical protein